MIDHNQSWSTMIHHDRSWSLMMDHDRWWSMIIIHDRWWSVMRIHLFIVEVVCLLSNWYRVCIYMAVSHVSVSWQIFKLVRLRNHISGKCPENVWEYIRKMLGKCPENVSNMFRKCLENVRKMFGKYLQNIWKISGNIWKLFGKCPENIWKMSKVMFFYGIGRWTREQMRTRDMFVYLVIHSF